MCEERKREMDDRESEFHLKEELLRLSSLFLEENPDPILCLNKRGELLYGNPSGRLLLKKIPSLKMFYSKISSADLKESENRSLTLTIDGKDYIFLLTPLQDESVLFLYGVDNTQYREAKVELKRLSKIIEESINMIFITDYRGSIEYVNSTFEKTTGFLREEAIGKNPRILASQETDPIVYEEMWRQIRSGKTWRGLLKNKKKNGTLYWANGFISPIRDERGEITHFLAIQEDVTERIVAEERLQYLSIHDRMTGLMTRIHFLELLDRYIKEDRNVKREALLLHVNIDGFNLINDSFGHSVGDQFLKSFATFLDKQREKLHSTYNLEGESFLGRVGGDEFALFINIEGREEALQIAEDIRRTVESYRFLGGSIRVTVSMGLALYPEHGNNSKDLFSQVNAATMQAKELGQNRYVLYSDKDTYLKKVQSILEEKQMIIRAMEEDRIIPWFQPILNLHSNQIGHYEALARLITEDESVLSPGSFIPTAERYGLISGIDRIITKKAIEYQGSLQRAGKNISFSMNLSGRHIGDEAMLSYLQETIERAGAHPGSIVFEITETAAIDTKDRAISFVRALKRMGCQFSLDDFGVGYTSFVHLLEMDLDYIKIDGSFVRKLLSKEKDRIVVKTIVDMAKNLGVCTIGEFVEDREIIPVLYRLGVDYAQGYCIGKPSPTLKDDWHLCDWKE